MTFWINYKSNNNAGILFFHLGFQKSDGKVKKEKDKMDKREYYGGKKEVIERRGKISEVSIYYYETYECVN